MGVLTIKTNYDMILTPEIKYGTYDYSQVFNVEIKSTSDYSITSGKFSSDKERMLSEGEPKSMHDKYVKDCFLRECEAYDKLYRVSVDDHTTRRLELNLQFDKPEIISTSLDG